MLDGSLFARVRRTFHVAILNPPYHKIRSDSDARHALRRIGVETSNLYTAFLALAIELLEPGGELVAITPRSFCNGPYFRPFRERLLAAMSLSRIHVFERRDKAFRDDAVLRDGHLPRREAASVRARHRLVERRPRRSVAHDARGLLRAGRSTRRPRAHLSHRHRQRGRHRRRPRFDLSMHPRGPRASGLYGSRGGLQGARTSLRRSRARDCTAHPSDAPASRRGRVAEAGEQEAQRDPREHRDVCAPVARGVLRAHEALLFERRSADASSRRSTIRRLYEASASASRTTSTCSTRTVTGCPSAWPAGSVAQHHARRRALSSSAHAQVNATDLRKMTWPTRAQLEALGDAVPARPMTQGELDETIERVLFA